MVISKKFKGSADESIVRSCNTNRISVSLDFDKLIFFFCTAGT